MTTIEEQAALDQLRAMWTHAKETYPAIALSAQQALRALESEAQANRLIAKTTRDNAFDAYTLCDAVHLLGKAVESWAYISARLWAECERKEAEEAIRLFHQSSVTKLQHLLVRHVALQDETYTFCREHQILVRLGVLTQSIDITHTGEQA